MKIEIVRKSKEGHSLLSSYLKICSLQCYIDNTNYIQINVRHFDKLIGVSCIFIGEKSVHICNTVIKEGYRCLGINRRINEFIEKFTRMTDKNLITLNIRESNLISINSFLSSGFIINEEADLTYKDGEKKLSLYKKINKI